MLIDLRQQIMHLDTQGVVSQCLLAVGDVAVANARCPACVASVPIFPHLRSLRMSLNSASKQVILRREYEHTTESSERNMYLASRRLIVQR